MKALVIGAPGRAGYEERAEPQVGDGEVLLQTLRVGLCGSDLNTFRGLNPLVSYPRVPGHEIVARIVARGANVPSELAEGLLATVVPYTACGKCTACHAERGNACRNNQTLGVQRDGALTELIALPWQKLIVCPQLNECELALVEPLSVGFHAVDRGRVCDRDTVLVLGCGMIGLGVIAAAGLDRGARVIAVDIDAAKLARARDCGAAHTIDSLTQQSEEVVAELTDGHGADVVIEAAGLPQTFRGAVQLASFAGRVVYIGYAQAPVTYETKYFVMKELDIFGSRNARRSDFERVINLLESGCYPSEATVTQTPSFKESAAAFEHWDRNPAAVTKIHVTFPG